MWESHADSDTRKLCKPGPERTLPIYRVDTLSEDMDDQVVAAVTTAQPERDQLETRLLWPMPGWMVIVGVNDLADAGMAFPTDFAEVVAADIAALAAAGVVTIGVVSLADAGVATVGVSDLADTGMALPADHAGAGTVGVASVADAGMMFPANLAGTVITGVAPGTVGGMTFPADPAEAVTVGVVDRTEVVDV